MSSTVLNPTDEGAPDIEGRPLPLVDHVSEQYFAAAADGKLLIQECPACGHRQFYPRACCTACAANTEWKEASGRGTVHTFTIIRQNWAMPFKNELPYVVAMVQLEEGPKMMTNITHGDPEAIEIGTPVEVYMVKVEDGLGLPFWRPVTGA
jgi:uncharacterized OB-fold protein